MTRSKNKGASPHLSYSPLSARSARFGGSRRRAARGAPSTDGRGAPRISSCSCLGPPLPMFAFRGQRSGDRRRGALSTIRLQLVRNGKDGTTHAWRSGRASARRCSFAVSELTSRVQSEGAYGQSTAPVKRARQRHGRARAADHERSGGVVIADTGWTRIMVAPFRRQGFTPPPRLRDRRWVRGVHRGCTGRRGEFARRTRERAGQRRTPRAQFAIYPKATAPARVRSLGSRYRRYSRPQSLSWASHGDRPDRAEWRAPFHARGCEASLTERRKLLRRARHSAITAGVAV